MEKSVAIVIGASRGIGFALAVALQTTGITVLATVRKGAEQFKGSGIEAVEGFDITAENGVETLSQALKGRKAGLLIIAAGAQEVDTFETVSKDSIRRLVEVNAIGPLFAVKGLLPSLTRGAKVVLLSSKNASITNTEQTGGELYAYRIGKVAVNMIGRTLAIDLKRLNDSPVALVHPGVVNTDMLQSLRRQRGVPEEKLTANGISAPESARRILELIDRLTLENTGSYWAADTGQIVEW